MDRRDFLRLSAQAALLSTAGSRLVAQPFGRGFVAGTADRMAWWREARFGMFCHFGLYSMLAGEWNGRTNYGEWIRNNARIPIGTYDTLLAKWNPEQFNADRMASLAAAAGMRYLVITTKHHDGFALFPTKHGEFNVTRTNFKRDLMREVVDACRKHGVVPCWYHSIMDWHHPDYLPRREWEEASRPATGANFDRFVQYLHGQVEELLTNYGDIGVMWFDGEWEPTWNEQRGAALLAHVNRLSAKTIVNSRVAPQPTNGLEATLSRPTYGDFGTPEQKVPDRGIPGVDWESCITMNGNWGYNRADKEFKSVGTLVDLLVETASKGGNLLLNIGPEGNGTIPAESVERLEGIARWMQVHGEAIHGTQGSPWGGTPFRATRTERRINCFFSGWPVEREVLLPGLRTLPRARFLGDRRRSLVPVRMTERGVVVRLPQYPPDHVCSVLALDFVTPPQIAG